LNRQSELGRKDDEAWERARYGNEMALSDYITIFQHTGKYVQEAKDKIKYLEQARLQAQAQKQRIMDNIKRNPNTYSPDEVKGFLRDCIVTKSELRDYCGIPDNIIQSIDCINLPSLQLGEKPSSIPDGYTEVYFWGIPGSGKTCALGAILNTAEKLGLLNIAKSEGSGYMIDLKNIFLVDNENPNPILPPPSPVETTQYLPFSLKKGKDDPRSVSLIELSGEIFQCFLCDFTNQPFPSQSHKDTFDTLTKFLSGNNPKIHFFFIDYDKENKKDANKKTQGDYLQAASAFFANPKNKIFGKSTAAIYLILTKSDLMPCEKEERAKEAGKHLANKFPSFITTLEQQCKTYSINAKELTFEPFSLGKVYFQQICDFDNSSAKRIIDILIERIRPNKKNILDVFNK
jgi:hypothetical protein